MFLGDDVAHRIEVLAPVLSSCMYRTCTEQVDETIVSIDDVRG